MDQIIINVDKHEDQVDIIEQALFGKSRAQNLDELREKTRVKFLASQTSKNISSKNVSKIVSKEVTPGTSQPETPKIVKHVEGGVDAEMREADYDQVQAQLGLQEKPEDKLNRNLFDQMYDKISELVSLTTNRHKIKLNFWISYSVSASSKLARKRRYLEAVRYDDDPPVQNNDRCAGNWRQTAQTRPAYDQDTGRSERTAWLASRLER